MKTVAIVCRVVGILALVLASWASAGIGRTETRSSEGLTAAEDGLAKQDWTVTASGVDQLYLANKDLYLAHAFEKLGLEVAIAFSCGSLLLLTIAIKKPNQSSRPAQAVGWRG